MRSKNRIETSAIAWTYDEISNDNTRKENISPNVSAAEVIGTSDHATTSTVESGRAITPTTEHATLATEEAVEEDRDALFTSKYQSKFPPKVVMFEMLKDYMHKKEYLEQNVLRENIKLGEQAFDILEEDGKGIPMDDFYKMNNISQTAQEAYSKGDSQIKIPRIPCEDNEMKENYSKVGIYVIVFIDAKGNIYVIKAGVNGDGMREGDYDLKSGQFSSAMIS
ncbi:predicted protein [Chaetoceros tenuissimus]|uniref:Uncharacterized protein n=1 Tax=Chaetoceros tenuissimus TaxID=426638 RepID=A0AAD3CXH0_9STRA|nr:predicted protein [Chaetoceros tenuissimus]